jgi:hypothetical protein
VTLFPLDRPQPPAAAIRASDNSKKKAGVARLDCQDHGHIADAVCRCWVCRLRTLASLFCSWLLNCFIFSVSIVAFFLFFAALVFLSTMASLRLCSVLLLAVLLALALCGRITRAAEADMEMGMDMEMESEIGAEMEAEAGAEMSMEAQAEIEADLEAAEQQVPQQPPVAMQQAPPTTDPSGLTPAGTTPAGGEDNSEVGMCEVCMYVLENKMQHQPYLCKGLKDPHYQNLCVQVMESLMWWISNQVYWVNYGCQMNQNGAISWVRPCPAHATCSWLQHLYLRKPYCAPDKNFPKPA